MQYLVVLTIALFAFAAADDDWKPVTAIHEIHDKCVEEAGLTKEQADSIHRLEASEDKEIKEYYLCNVKKNEIFDEENGYNTERIMKVFTLMKLDTQKAEEIVTKCSDKNEQKSAAVEWAYRVIKCMTESNLSELFKEAQERIKKEHNEA